MLDPNKPSKWWIIMTGNIWKSYLCTAAKKWDVSDPRSYEHYWTSSWNETWKKFRALRDLNSWPLRYRCSALPTELTSQLVAGHNVGSNCSSLSYYFAKFPRKRFSTRLVSGSFIHNNFFTHTITRTKRTYFLKLNASRKISRGNSSKILLCFLCFLCILYQIWISYTPSPFPRWYQKIPAEIANKDLVLFPVSDLTVFQQTLRFGIFLLLFRSRKSLTNG